MGLKDRGPRPKPDARARFLRDLKATFEWRGDRPNPRWAADPTGWWADASILRRLGPTLAEPFTDLQPTLVIGPQSREPSSARSSPSISGWVVELRKDPDRSADSERWLTTRTPPDYQDRNLELGLRRDLLPSTARALFVDDWDRHRWPGRGSKEAGRCRRRDMVWRIVIVDALEDPRLRGVLDVKCLFRVNDL